MKLIILVLVLAALAENLTECVNIQSLFSQMTLEEKCGQMMIVDIGLILSDNIGNPSAFSDHFVSAPRLLEALNVKHLGAMFNAPYLAVNKAGMARYITLLHEFALNSTRLKIPILHGMDFIHGADLINDSVLFPPQLAQASSFNTDIARGVGEITARETRAMGVVWNFSPVLDIGRQPLWPR